MGSSRALALIVAAKPYRYGQIRGRPTHIQFTVFNVNAILMSCHENPEYGKIRDTLNLLTYLIFGAKKTVLKLEFRIK